jgi:hypothetical protein
MALQPTAEETARLILTVFVAEFDCRPGETLRATSFYKALSGRKDDFAPGIDYAAEQGWIETVSDVVFRLTEYGYTVATQSIGLKPRAVASQPPVVKKPAHAPTPPLAKKQPAPPARVPGTVTLDPEEAEFILRFVSGQSVVRNPVLQERIKAKIIAEATRIAKGKK